MTPMMQQYWDIKNQHKDHLLLYRLGDFYELFFEDAKVASAALNLTLTGRDCGEGKRAPMCGVPCHSADAYIARLIRMGHKVAICEQMENPAAAKGMVRREVVRVVTPGTLVESSMLDEQSNNYIACLYAGETTFGLSLSDTSVGALYATTLEKRQIASLQDILARYMPAEIILSSNLLDYHPVVDFITEKLHCTADVMPDEAFYPVNALRQLEEHFARPFDTLGFPGKDASLSSTGALLSYLYETQRKGLQQLSEVVFLREGSLMRLPISTRRNLELTQTIRTGERKGSLLWVLDKTKTPMGRRLLRAWLDAPLVNVNDINLRLRSVSELFSDTMLREDLLEAISGLPDFERYLTRVLYGSATPRELVAIASGLRRLPSLKSFLAPCKARLLTEIQDDIHPLEDLASLLERAISDTPPATLKDGDVFRPGFDETLDRLNDLLGNTKQILLDLEQREKTVTGIKNLKVAFNRVFGYYLEVSKTNLSLVPSTYIRKQTLANCERFVTEELKQLEEDILSADTQLRQREIELYNALLSAIQDQLLPLKQTAAALARLDVLCCLAHVAVQNDYCCPTVDLHGEIRITDGRHPVVELVQQNTPFVANDVLLDNQDNLVAVITGPNMAGKSTYMRQTALIVLMAQMGSFVPARSAVIGVVDGIYTRVGAMDDLSAGQSTFMVEMTELAELLRLSTRRSLLVLDEIGRGTSTYDGMSIARSVIEYIANKKQLGAKALFSTHYHELTELERDIPGVKNYNVACKKRGDDVIFLRRIVPGGADESFGIEVSRLAGVPEAVIRRAKVILKELESKDAPAPKVPRAPKETSPQISFLPNEPSPVEQQLLKLDLNTVTPLEALQILFNLRKMIP